MNKKISYNYFLEKIIYIGFKLFSKHLFSDKLIKRIGRELSYKQSKNNFVTYHLRPKQIETIIDDKILIKSNSKTAIVMQGVIKKEDDFTYNTLKLYKKIFSDTTIILSVWEDEDEKYLEKIKSLNIKVIKNKKPDKGGFANLNYQIINTSSGVELAKKLGCSYVLKTRTDIRIYETGVKDFLISLLKSFPSNTYNQKERIIGIDINTHKYGIGISDLFQFGTTEEMLKMWDGILYYKDISREEYTKLERKSNGIDRFNIEYSECYLLKNYLRKNNIELLPSLKSYYQVLKNNFIIIDAPMIDMYWRKYLGSGEYSEWKNYTKKIRFSSMKFKDWLTIYKNDYSVNENILLKTYEEWEALTIEDIENEKCNDSSKC